MGAKRTHRVPCFGGLQNGGFQKCGFGGCSPTPTNRNEGTFGCSPVPKTRTRVHSDVPQYWEFPNLVVSNLVVCNFYVEALFLAHLHPFALFCGLAFALFCVHLRSFALICVLLRTTAFRTTAFGNCRQYREPVRGYIHCTLFRNRPFVSFRVFEDVLFETVFDPSPNDKGRYDRDRQRGITEGIFSLWDSLESLGSLELRVPAIQNPSNPQPPVFVEFSSGCRKRSAAKGVRSLFFVFGTLSVTFRSLFLTLLSLFSSLFCQTPFAGLLLRQGDFVF